MRRASRSNRGLRALLSLADPDEYSATGLGLAQPYNANTPQRVAPREVNEDAHNHARALDGTPAFEKSSNQRKKIEMRFAHLKTHHRFERMRLPCLFLVTASRMRACACDRLPGSASGPCFAVPHSPWPRPFAPRAPLQPRLLCSLASLLL